MIKKFFFFNFCDLSLRKLNRLISTQFKVQIVVLRGAEIVRIALLYAKSRWRFHYFCKSTKSIGKALMKKESGALV